MLMEYIKAALGKAHYEIMENGSRGFPYQDSLPRKRKFRATLLPCVEIIDNPEHCGPFSSETETALMCFNARCFCPIYSLNFWTEDPNDYSFWDWLNQWKELGEAIKESIAERILDAIPIPWHLIPGLRSARGVSLTTGNSIQSGRRASCP